VPVLARMTAADRTRLSGGRQHERNSSIGKFFFERLQVQKFMINLMNANAN
jgi:hypothetical protein